MWLIVSRMLVTWSVFGRVDPDSALYTDLIAYKKDGFDHILLNCSFKASFDLLSRTAIFTGRQRSCKPCTSYDRDVRLSVRPSVRLSVCHWHWVKTTQARITKSSPTDSPMILVFGIKNSSRNSKGVPRARALNESGVGKIRNFQPITRRISETIQDRTKVTINH